MITYHHDMGLFLCLIFVPPLSWRFCPRSLRPCVRARVPPWCCFCNIYGTHWWIFTKRLSPVHLGTKMFRFGISWSKGKITAWPNKPKNRSLLRRYLRFAPNLRRQCIVVHRQTDYVLGAKGQWSRSQNDLHSVTDLVYCLLLRICL